MKRRLIMFLAAILTALAGCNDRPNSGDRVLVAKFLYETQLSEPNRFDVVVFKYPKEPLEKNVPKNYIKRLLGLPGEILAIFFGRLFHIPAPNPGDPSPFNDQGKDPNTLWEKWVGMHENESNALFEAGKFAIIRKPPDVMLALRRIVYDNDFPAKDLTGPGWERWRPMENDAWKTDKNHGFIYQAAGKDTVDWLRYRHILRPLDEGQEKPLVSARKPELITDFMAYNSFFVQSDSDKTPSPNWVGDLMLECNLQVTKAEGEFWLELNKGINRFQARWDLSSGMCTLFQQGMNHKLVELDSKPTRIKGPGNYLVRFANIDARLTVWVDSELPFANGRAYSPPEIRGPGEDKQKVSDDDLKARRGPTANDLEPASIGSKGAAVQVRALKLWRDTYYTQNASKSSDVTPPDVGDWYDPKNRPAFMDALADSNRWGFFKEMPVKTMYVQPGHYLCLGDNSQASSDSREWGLVPHRLMLGRALLVYFPFNRAGAIR